MKLWIRSQDKDILQKTTNIYVQDNYIKTYDNANSCEIYLGIYKTKERALEVLDEIQKCLKSNALMNANYRYVYGSDGQTYKITDNNNVQRLTSCVYEMPKE